MSNPTLSPRPWRIFWLLLGLLTLGVVHTWQAMLLWQYRNLLADLTMTAAYYGRLGFAALWAIIWLIATIALWRRLPPTQTGIPVLWLLYTLYRLGWLHFVVQSEVARQTWPAQLSLMLIIALVILWCLYRPTGRAYFTTGLTDRFHPSDLTTSTH
ncbi:MAG TPA: hypothetical protein VLL52_20660 [Anaerolineae bacterium]|nr:hypothetical protein [Anaerolineae bacterium]